MNGSSLINLLHEYYKAHFDGKEPNEVSNFLVAIDGRGGAGKTSLREYLTPLLPEYFLLHGDIYFEPTPSGPAFGSFNDARFINEIFNPAIAGSPFLCRSIWT